MPVDAGRPRRNRRARVEALRGGGVGEQLLLVSLSRASSASSSNLARRGRYPTAGFHGSLAIAALFVELLGEEL
jgi:hypothetical protein